MTYTRLRAAMLAVVLLVGGGAVVLGAAPASAQVSRSAPPELAPAGPGAQQVCPGPDQRDYFTDDDGSAHEANTDCARAHGLVSGLTETTFGPGQGLTRAQAVTMLVRYVETSSGETLAASPTPSFSDTAGTTHATNIEKAYQAGILTGYPDDTFRPGAPVTREQFASLAVQATEGILGASLETNGVDAFQDDDDSVHQDNIEKASDNDMISGAQPGQFRPEADVTRAQSATMLVNAVTNVLAPAGRFVPLG